MIGDGPERPDGPEPASDGPVDGDGDAAHQVDHPVHDVHSDESNDAAESDRPTDPGHPVDLTKPTSAGPARVDDTASFGPITFSDGSTRGGGATDGSEPAGTEPGAGDPTSAGTDGAATEEPTDGRHRRQRRKDKPKRKAPWWEIPALVVVAILIAILVKSFIVQPFYIPSGSMEKTLHGCPGCEGDRILVNKVIFDFRDPEPGDIVVFDAPPGWDDEPTNNPPSNPILKAVRGFGQLVGFVPPDGEVLVKRVIAVGGQTVRGYADGRVQVKDKPGGAYRTLSEPYVYNGDSQQPDQNFGPVTVPPGRLWVMGDHRTNSEDSRYHCSSDGESSDSDINNCGRFATQSTVPVDNVIGKAFVIAWPPSRWTTLGTPSTFDSAAAPFIPSAASLLTVGPLYVFRRRSRRRRPIPV